MKTGTLVLFAFYPLPIRVVDPRRAKLIHLKMTKFRLYPYLRVKSAPILNHVRIDQIQITVEIVIIRFRRT